jgi:hypothetical protein
MTHEEALAFATAARRRSEWPPTAPRHVQLRHREQGPRLSEADRKKLLRAGPVTAEALEKIAGAPSLDSFPTMSIEELRPSVGSWS